MTKASAGRVQGEANGSSYGDTPSGEGIRAARILIVDDMSINRRIIGAMLADTGYEVCSASGGVEALDAIERDPPDLVVLDVNMPDLDGFEVCRRLKARDDFRHVPVIFVSGLDESIDKVEGLQAGGADYLTKPFQADELRARIQSHLKVRWYQARLADQNLALEEALARLQGAQSLLVQSERLASIGLLTAGVAHEVNNPLNSIRASARALPRVLAPVLALLREAGADEPLEALAELTANIVEGSDRIAGIVAGLRTFSRMDQGAFVPTEIEAELDATLRLLRHRIEPNIEIERDYGDVPAIHARPGALMQVFTNLLANAIDAMQEREGARTITLQTRRVAEPGPARVSVSVRDAGGGLSAEAQVRMFEPFYTTKPVGEGTGLGLAISHGIVVAHGGTLELRDTGPAGSLFVVTLPVHPPQSGGA